MHWKKKMSQKSQKATPPEPEEFKCQYCHSVFTRKLSLNYHIKNKHFTEGFNTLKHCSVCEEAYVTTVGLQSHMWKEHWQIMVQQRPWEPVHMCAPCNRAFSTKAGLHRHKRQIHFADLFPCSYCPQIFDTQLLALKHYNTDHSCPMCKQFVGTSFTLHLKTVHNME